MARRHQAIKYGYITPIISPRQSKNSTGSEIYLPGFSAFPCVLDVHGTAFFASGDRYGVPDHYTNCTSGF